MKRMMRALVLALPLSLLAGCGEEDKSTAMVRQAVAMESSDECHLCGMIITNFPGPKGQLYAKGTEGTMKFCSTRDMFAFITDPENQHNIKQAFVHDMAVTPWNHPDEETYIDAKKAFYVIGHGKRGAMGATLASFSKKLHAEAFAKAQGGRVLPFDQITLEVLTAMRGG